MVPGVFSVVSPSPGSEYPSAVTTGDAVGVGVGHRTVVDVDRGGWLDAQPQSWVTSVVTYRSRYRLRSVLGFTHTGREHGGSVVGVWCLRSV